IYPTILTENDFQHRDEWYYPFEERGLQFGDGVYEVIRIYNGAFHLLEEHIDRLYRSLAAIKINAPYEKETLIHSLYQLIKVNNVSTDSIIYLQITRGSAPREHTFPEAIKPNMYAYIKDLPRKEAQMMNGVKTITKKDERWDNCYIKSLNLLPNVLAKQTAKENGCYEAILYRDGFVTECSSSNVYLVKDKQIFTHPPTNNILHGCVRMKVKQLAMDFNIPFIEEPFPADSITSADELFLSSTTSEIMPIIQVD